MAQQIMVPVPVLTICEFDPHDEGENWLLQVVFWSLYYALWQALNVLSLFRNGKNILEEGLQLG